MMLAWTLNNFLKRSDLIRKCTSSDRGYSSIFEINSAEFLIAGPNFGKIIRILSGYITCTCSAQEDGLRDKYIQNYVHTIAITRAVFHSQENLSSYFMFPWLQNMYLKTDQSRVFLACHSYDLFNCLTSIRILYIVVILWFTTYI